MDYYQGVVLEYLRANRSTFVNTEFCLEISSGFKEPPKGTSWYIDLLAVKFDIETVYLCEVTYSLSQADLVKKLAAWALVWENIRAAIYRDARIPENWSIKLWLFVPENKIAALKSRLPSPFEDHTTITSLEDTQPWKYHSFKRLDEQHLSTDV